MCCQGRGRRWHVADASCLCASCFGSTPISEFCPHRISEFFQVSWKFCFFSQETWVFPRKPGFFSRFPGKFPGNLVFDVAETRNFFRRRSPKLGIYRAETRNFRTPAETRNFRFSKKFPGFLGFSSNFRRNSEFSFSKKTKRFFFAETRNFLFWIFFGFFLVKLNFFCFRKWKTESLFDLATSPSLSRRKVKGTLSPPRQGVERVWGHP